MYYSAQTEVALEKSQNVEKELMEQLQTSMDKCKELETTIEGSPWKVRMLADTGQSVCTL